MKMLKPYEGGDFDFYLEVIRNKKKSAKDPSFKNRISLLNGEIERLFEVYGNHFGSNSLEQLSIHGFKDGNKEDLLSLYSYKAKIFQQLKLKVTTTETNRVISTCQNCTIGEVNSLDHYLPKDEFAEFVVNPKNLIPSCSRCNGHKNTAWRDRDKRLFLNLYLDKLPEKRYLFVNTFISNGIIQAKFFLANPNGIDPDLFELIENHYEKLHLCKRFSENIDSVVTDLNHTIMSFIGKIPLNEIVESVVERSAKNKAAFGHNYWKSVLEIALVNDKHYLNQFV